MTILDDDKKTLLGVFKLALKVGLQWMSYRSEENLRYGTANFHDSKERAQQFIGDVMSPDLPYKVMPLLPLYKKLRRQCVLERFHIVRAKPLRFEPEKLGEKYRPINQPKTTTPKDELTIAILDGSFKAWLKKEVVPAIKAIEKRQEGENKAGQKTTIVPPERKNGFRRRM